MFNVTKEGQMKAFNYIFAEIGWSGLELVSFSNN